MESGDIDCVGLCTPLCFVLMFHKYSVHVGESKGG
jgi:hypothetical protein